MRIQQGNAGAQTASSPSPTLEDSGMVVPFNAPSVSSFDQVLASVSSPSTGAPAPMAEPAPAMGAPAPTSGTQATSPSGTVWPPVNTPFPGQPATTWPPVNTPFPGQSAPAGSPTFTPSGGQSSAVWPPVNTQFPGQSVTVWPPVNTPFAGQPGVAGSAVATPSAGQSGAMWPAVSTPYSGQPATMWPPVTAPFPTQYSFPGQPTGQTVGAQGTSGLPTNAPQMGYAGMQGYYTMMPVMMMVPVMVPYSAQQTAQIPTVTGAIPGATQSTASGAVTGVGGTMGVGGALPAQGQQATGDALRLPFDGAPDITQTYGPTDYAAEPSYKGYSHFHTGIDFGLPTGTPIGAAASGTVVSAGWDSTGYGNRVLINHGNGRYTLYGHLDQVTAKPGEWVQAGDQIGLSGSTGNSSGPHLHFGVEVNGEWVDPAPYLFQGGAVTPAPAGSGSASTATGGGGDPAPVQDSSGSSSGAASLPIFSPAGSAGSAAPASGDNPGARRSSRAPGLPADLPIFNQPSPAPGPRAGQNAQQGGAAPPGAATSVYTPAITRGPGVPVFSPAGTTAPTRASSGDLPANLPILSPASAVSGQGTAAGPIGGGSSAPQPYPAADPTGLDGMIQQVAGSVGVPASLLAAVVQAESSGDPNAVSSSGAKGLMQLMDGTAAQYGVTDSFDPQQSLTGGATFLRDLLVQFSGNERLAIAAYNAGPTAVTRYGGVPPYPETQQYVQKVLGLEQTYAARYAGANS